MRDGRQGAVRGAGGAGDDTDAFLPDSRQSAKSMQFGVCCSFSLSGVYVGAICLFVCLFV